MRYLNKVIYLGAFLYNGFVETRPINGDICSDLNVVFNNNISDLWDPLMHALDCRKSKPIASYNCAAVYNYFITDYHTLPYYYIRINHAVSSYFCMGSYIHTCVKNTILFYLNTIFYDNIRLYSNIAANPYLLAYNSTRVYTLWFPDFIRGHQGYHFCKCH